MTQPTMGLGSTRPRPFMARRVGRGMNFWSWSEGGGMKSFLGRWGNLCEDHWQALELASATQNWNALPFGSQLNGRGVGGFLFFFGAGGEQAVHDHQPYPHAKQDVRDVEDEGEDLAV